MLGLAKNGVPKGGPVGPPFGLASKFASRPGSDSEAGFTLIELLVVMLILGILAAIALPAFFNQREKAGDAKAKETVHTVQVAIETCATEHAGSYASCDQEALHEIEPTLPEEGGTPEIEVEGEAKSYAITVTSEMASGDTFSAKDEEGSYEYPCTEKGVAGCPPSGFWHGG